MLRHYDGLRANWDHLLAGDFGADQQTDLLFYRNRHGEGSLYLMQEDGALRARIRTPLTLHDVPQTRMR